MIDAKKKVLVLMSTYNGIRNLESQIESIESQDNVEAHLLIRDDASTDGTDAVLRSISERCANINCIYGKENIGPKRSFLKLITISDSNYEYYALADQDDLWLPDKLACAISSLDELDSSKPQAYGSSVILLHEGGMGKTEYTVQGDLTLGNFLFKNYFPGCTLVFNKKVKELVSAVDYTELNDFPLHDHWICLVCLACGGRIAFDNEPHILYRQHNNNVVGHRGVIEKIKQNGLFGKAKNVRLSISQELLEKYGALAGNAERAQLERVVAYQESFRNRLSLAFDLKIAPKNLIEIISSIALFLSGKY